MDSKSSQTVLKEPLSVCFVCGGNHGNSYTLIRPMSTLDPEASKQRKLREFLQKFCGIKVVVAAMCHSCVRTVLTLHNEITELQCKIRGTASTSGTPLNSRQLSQLGEMGTAAGDIDLTLKDSDGLMTCSLQTQAGIKTKVTSGSDTGIKQMTNNQTVGYPKSVDCLLPAVEFQTDDSQPVMLIELPKHAMIEDSRYLICYKKTIPKSPLMVRKEDFMSLLHNVEQFRNTPHYVSVEDVQKGRESDFLNLYKKQKTCRVVTVNLEPEHFQCLSEQNFLGDQQKGSENDFLTSENEQNASKVVPVKLFTKAKLIGDIVALSSATPESDVGNKKSVKTVCFPAKSFKISQMPLKSKIADSNRKAISEIKLKGKYKRKKKATPNPPYRVEFNTALMEKVPTEIPAAEKRKLEQVELIEVLPPTKTTKKLKVIRSFITQNNTGTDSCQKPEMTVIQSEMDVDRVKDDDDKHDIDKDMQGSDGIVNEHVQETAEHNCYSQVKTNQDGPSLSEPTTSENGERSMNQFVCEICHKVFDAAKKLLAHLKKEHKLSGKKFICPCPYCDMVFLSEKWQKNHIIKKHSDSSNIFCGVCRNSGGKNVTEFKKHDEKCCLEYKHQCGTCSLGFKTRNGLWRHLGRKKHSGMKCRKCEESFTSKRAFEIHMNKENGVTFICNLCGEELGTRLLLRLHVRKHDKTVKLCYVCGWKTMSHGSYKYHMQFHKTGGQKCELCGFVLTKKSKLLAHMAVHNPYVCPACNMVFMGMMSMRTHYKEKCSRRAENGLNFPDNFEKLDEIKYDNHSASDFKCHGCQKTIKAYFKSIMRHLEYRSSCRECHRCNYCSQMCESKETLSTHESKHQSPYVCSYCQTGFLSWDKCCLHMKKHITKSTRKKQYRFK